MVRLPERTRFMKGLFAWVGFKQTAIYYQREERQAGGTKWNYWRLWNFAMDGITSFSSFPLKVWSYFGFTISVLAFLYAVVLAIRKIFHDVDVPGYTSLMVVLLFLGGIQLITLGILGEYMGRVYNEVKGRTVVRSARAARIRRRLTGARRTNVKILRSRTLCGRDQGRSRPARDRRLRCRE